MTDCLERAMPILALCAILGIAPCGGWTAEALAAEGSAALSTENKEMAEAITVYHKGPWEEPDPTAGQPGEVRYVPPEGLQDFRTRSIFRSEQPGRPSHEQNP